MSIAMFLLLCFEEFPKEFGYGLPENQNDLEDGCFHRKCSEWRKRTQPFYYEWCDDKYLW